MGAGVRSGASGDQPQGGGQTARGGRDAAAGGRDAIVGSKVNQRGVGGDGGTRG